ncbi:hypothetical protein F5887DRAFT_967661, partial [Amanita rubescens]
HNHNHPSNDINEFLTLLARRMGMINPTSKYYFVNWWREERGPIAAADSSTTHASLDMIGSAAAKVQGEPRRTTTEDGRVTVQGWVAGFDFEWRVEKEQVVAGLASTSMNECIDAYLARWEVEERERREREVEERKQRRVRRVTD